ncbi:MAG: hypothetical protein ACLQJF_16190 [Candidatus Sulfotelmatobacter sp.]
MRIKFTEYAADPKLRGTTSNFPAHIAQSLIAQGAAVQVPYKGFRERLAAEAAEGHHPQNTSVTAVAVPTWGIHTGLNGTQVLVRRFGFEETRFETPEDAVRAGCPVAIAAQLRSVVNHDIDGLRHEADEIATKAKAKQEAAERLDRIRTGASLYILGKKMVKPL